MMDLPVTAQEVGNFWGLIVSHESGHLLGLVQPGLVLDGSDVGTPSDVTGGHNKNPYGRRVMNPGASNTLEEELGREGGWAWRVLNVNYLKFVLPKE